MASLASQLAAGILSLPSEAGTTGGLPAHLAFIWVLGLYSLVLFHGQCLTTSYLHRTGGLNVYK